MTAVFAEIESTLVEKGFAVTEQNHYSKTYSKLNTSDKGWTEIILDHEYAEVIKDVYGADNRRLNHMSTPVKIAAAVTRMIG